MFCPNLQCEAVIPPQAHYCPQCGAALYAEPPPERAPKPACAVRPTGARPASAAPPTMPPTIPPTAWLLAGPAAGKPQPPKRQAKPDSRPARAAAVNDFLVLDGGWRRPDLDAVANAVAYMLAVAGAGVLLMALLGGGPVVLR